MRRSFNAKQSHPIVRSCIEAVFRQAPVFNAVALRICTPALLTLPAQPRYAQVRKILISGLRLTARGEGRPGQCAAGSRKTLFITPGRIFNCDRSADGIVICHPPFLDRTKIIDFSRHVVTEAAHASVAQRSFCVTG